MKKRFMLLVVAVVATASVAGGRQLPARTSPSPTGFEPKLLWTPQRQAIWNQMKTEDGRGARTLGAEWYRLAKDNAECACRYGDSGLWATLMYQWTGDKRYAELAWARLAQFIARPVADTDGNYIREHGMEKVILLEWLRPALTPERRDQLKSAIAAMLNYSLNGKQPLRLNDSDQVVGTYFAAVLFALTHPEDPAAAAMMNHPRIGGLDATAANRSNARNAIRSYVENLAEGGEWIESAAYNLGTVNLLLVGAEAVRTATGVDHFPEVTRWTPLWARRQMAFWTPDLSQAYQWGDEEHPRDNRLFKWADASGVAAGLLAGSSVGAQLQQHLLDLVAKYGTRGHCTMEPAISARLYFVFNPYARAQDWRTERVFSARGTGLLLYRTGFTPNDSLFAAHLAPRTPGLGVDHLVRYFNNFELWRKGEWAITHPRAYAGAPNGGLGTNAVAMHGFGDMLEFKELVGSATGDAFAYQAGTTGGAAVASNYHNPPPVFVHEWSRSVLYLSGATDTVVVHDRAHVTDVSRRDRYHQRDIAVIDRAPSPKQWLLHMPVAPKIEGTSVTWTTPRGQPVRWFALLPEGAVKTPYDERALRKAREPGWASIRESEVKHHVRVWPAVKTDWDTFLNVIQVGGSGSADLVTIPGDIDAVRIGRPGQPDVVAVFNARPSERIHESGYHSSHAAALRRARLRTEGYTIKWRASTDTTDAYIADLDPARSWSIEIDGRTSMLPASVDLHRLSVPRPGDHVLTVRPTTEPNRQVGVP